MQGEPTRDRILDAARNLFDAEGEAGLSMRRIATVVGITPMAIYRHYADKDALKNALIPVITAISVWTAFLIGGTVLLEQVFAIPGVGRLILSAIQDRDYPIIQGTVVFLSFCVALTMLISDILVALVDPRVKFN